MAASPLDLSTAADILEELYFADGLLNDLVMRELPTLLAMTHTDDGGSEGWHQPVQYTNPLGFGPTYTDAQTNITAGDYTKFVGDFEEYIGIFRVAGSLLRRGRANKTLLVDHLDREMKGAIAQLKQELGVLLFSNGGGAKAREGGTWTSGDDIVLEEGQAYHFDVGEVIQAASTDGTSGSVRDGSTFITAVDYDSDTITVDDITDITDFAQDDYIFKNGFFGKGISGLGGWIPLTPTTFRTVDQTLNPNRLAGVRHTGSTTIYQSLSKLRRKIEGNKMGASVDFIALNPDDFADLEIEMEGRKRLIEGKMEGKAGAFAGIGVDSIKLRGADVVPDQGCPVGHAFMLSRDTFKWRSCGELIEKVQDDGSLFVRKDGSDNYEGRIWSCGDVLCSNPGANGRVSLP